MTVAWIGNRDTSVQQAISRAAELLAASWCPVISLDTDIHGTRAALALANRIGAAYDHVDGDALARETALASDSGGMFTTAGEVDRRADLVVIVGPLPRAHHGYVARLAESMPDLGQRTRRALFVLADERDRPESLNPDTPATLLSCDGSDLAGAVAALRAQCAGRPVTKPVTGFGRFAEALEEAKFTVFLCSGEGTHELVLEMLQGLIADVNKKRRASALTLPASAAGWGATQVSAWTTGFPMRTSFGRGIAEHDPWRWDVRRMVEEGEADIHLWIAAERKTPYHGVAGTELIALTKTDEPVAEAAVTIPVGAPGSDHDAVTYSTPRGTFTGIEAATPSQLPSVAAILAAMTELLPNEAGVQC